LSTFTKVFCTVRSTCHRFAQGPLLFSTGQAWLPLTFGLKPPNARGPEYDLRVTTLPTWALYLLSFGTPIFAFVGVAVGQIFLRKGANELDVWRRREETMRMLRWASDEAASKDGTKSRMGVAALGALSTSELLQEPDQNLVDAVLDSIIEAPLDEIEEAAGDVDVVEVDYDHDN
jgi:hypothetical protein